MKVNKADEFYKILERKAIYPVFQPIVNLQTGRVSGYEALSRIDRSSTTLTISDLFVIAEQLGCVWKLEKLCRNKALKAAVEKPENVKLFLNVDGNIIQDKAFIGIGLKPSLCGKGIGGNVMKLLIGECNKRFPNYLVALEVRSFNKRAIRCYENIGFEINKKYTKVTLTGNAEFYLMDYKSHK